MYKLDSVGGRLELVVKVDGRIEGGTFPPQPHEVIVADVLHVGALARVALRVLLVAVVVAVGEQVEAPEAVGPPALGQTQGGVHEGLAGPLKQLLGLVLHLALGPVGVQPADQLLGLVAVDVLGAPVAHPLRAPVFPVDDAQAPEILERDELVDVGASFAQVLCEALVLR